MPKTSRIPGFYKLAPAQRLSHVRRIVGIEPNESFAFDASDLPLEVADLIIENVIGTFALPLGVALNLLVNGRDVLVPMVVEEPSVVAAVSNMARVVREAGGFSAEADPSVMIGQIEVLAVPDPEAATRALEAEFPRLVRLGDAVNPRLLERGGGFRGMRVRRLTYDEPGQPTEDILVVHFYLDCVDAMGANMVNSVAECLAPDVEAITGGRVLLRILSNLASRRLARARCSVPVGLFHTEELEGREVAEGIAAAYRFAWADPWRATTHNKGIMNGVDAVALATGNDWRAIEAGAHAWAAREGQYRPLSRWRHDADAGMLHGDIEIPIQVGTVGGPIKAHPAVAGNLRILGNPRARELAAIMAAVGLSQNLGALRALASEGIQQGHMRLHARSVARNAGATHDEVPAVVRHLCAAQDWSEDEALVALGLIRS